MKLLQNSAIEALKPDQLLEYVASLNWIKDADLGDIATVWHRPEPAYQDYELILPLNEELKDYQHRIIDVINTLSEFENRSFIDIAKDINNFKSDVIKIRVIHEDVKAGSIPLNDGVMLFEKAKDLMSAVVKSTFHKRKYFSGGKPTDELNDFFDNLLLGQTEHGSYVVNLISPILDNQKDQEDHSSISLTRSVSDTLSRSLSAIHSSINEYRDTERLTVFDDGVEQGVSANLCDALIGLSGKKQLRDIEINISMSKTEIGYEDIVQHHRFNADVLPYLEVASKYYKDNYLMEGVTITGSVTKLHYTDNDEYGQVTIDATVNNSHKNVTIELPASEYWQAFSAHGHSKLVECFGDLHVTHRGAKLINPTKFRVFGNDDMFDEA